MGCGGGRPGGPGRLGETAGRAGGGPARLGWAARRTVCGPGGRAVRGSGERAAPTSGVSPLQIGSEGGGSGGRDANKKEQAGGLARPLPPGCRRGRLGGRGLGPLSRPPRSHRRAFGAHGQGAWPSCGAALACVLGPGQRAQRPCLFRSALRRVSQLSDFFPPHFSRDRASGHARPRGDKDGGVPLCENTSLAPRVWRSSPPESPHQETALAPQSCGARSLSVHPWMGTSRPCF